MNIFLIIGIIGILIYNLFKYLDSRFKRFYINKSIELILDLTEKKIISENLQCLFIDIICGVKPQTFYPVNDVEGKIFKYLNSNKLTFEERAFLECNYFYKLILILNILTNKVNIKNKEELVNNIINSDNIKFRYKIPFFNKINLKEIFNSKYNIDISYSINKLSGEYLTKVKTKDFSYRKIARSNILEDKLKFITELTRDIDYSIPQFNTPDFRPEYLIHDSLDRITKEISIITNAICDEYIRILYPDTPPGDIVMSLEFPYNYENTINSLSATIIDQISNNLLIRLSYYIKKDSIFYFIRKEFAIKYLDNYINKNKVIEENIPIVNNSNTDKINYIKSFKRAMIKLFINGDTERFITTINKLNNNYLDNDQYMYEALNDYKMLPPQFRALFNISENTRSSILTASKYTIDNLNLILNKFITTYTQEGFIQLLAECLNTSYDNVYNQYSNTIIPEIITIKNKALKGLECIDGYTVNQNKFLRNTQDPTIDMNDSGVTALRLVLSNNKDIKGANCEITESGITWIRDKVQIKTITKDDLDLLTEEIRNNSNDTRVNSSFKEIKETSPDDLEREALIMMYGEKTAETLMKRDESQRFYNSAPFLDNEVLDENYLNITPEDARMKRNKLLNELNNIDDSEFKMEIANILNGEHSFTSNEVYQFKPKSYSDLKEAIKDAAIRESAYRSIKKKITEKE